MPETTAVVPSPEPDAEAFTELFHAHFRGVYVNLRRLGVPVALMFLFGVFPDLILRWTNPTVLRWAGGP